MTERGAYRFAIPADPTRYYDTGQGHGACWEGSVSLRMEGKQHWTVGIPARKATRAPTYTPRLVILNGLVEVGSGCLS